ncbi:hypothetical protein FAM19025_002300 [Propionibacterium freudenreichii]|uniref:DUF6541 family protein n=2 Tax=Propionibacterium freudenreichii TaxID=1744 RepID=UPI0022B900A6|nr:DUF6541 family protein [Propionibacterium freudenreichii]MCT3015662.1 hypothetical protein [Propionibacterium freudenreichii]WBF59727.1 hypothetical protein LJ113_00110 [Propionibacterium freudenreichii]WFF35065.1 hypothetical protein FAM19025_002300 [Propionibacterium freudenreichii]WFF37293.1 hypothetical protein FAM14221_002299 [Propionibacterium freudenreichii]
MTWLGFVPLVAATIGLLLVPGVIVALCAGLPARIALPIAPGVSTAIIVVAAIAADAVGMGWNLWPVAIITIVCAAGCWWMRRIVSRVVDAGAIASRVRRRQASSSTRTTPRRGWWLAGGLLGVFLTGWHMIAQIGRPDNFAQSFDNMFHLNAVRWILDHSNGSSLTMSMTSGDGPTSFYPLAWHDVISLALKTANSADVAAGTNAMVLVISSVVWVLGCFYLIRMLGRATVPGVVAVGVLVCAFPTFPYLSTSYGVLYPNTLGMTLLPAMVALTYQIFLDPRAPKLRSTIPVALLAGFGMVLAHPNTAALYCVFAFPLIITWLVHTLRADRPRWQLVGACILTAATAVIIAVIWKFLRPADAAGIWPPIVGWRRALWQAVTLTPMVERTTVLPLAVIVAIGAVVTIITRRHLWLLAAHVIMAFLWIAVASFPFGPLRTFLVGIWYNDPYRLAASLPLTALPLAAIGANSIGAWLLRFAHLRVPANVVASPRLEATLKWATTLVLALVLMLVTQLPATYRQALRAASDIYRITPDANVIDPDEYALLKQLPQLVPAGQRVATVPYNGSSLAYALENVDTTTTHILYVGTPDITELNQGLRDAETRPSVCHAMADMNVHYALDFGPVEVNRWNYRAFYPGFADLNTAPGFVPIASSGHAVLYRIDACG